VNACRALEGKPALSLAEMVSQGIVEYVDFPAALKGKYQSFTQADICELRATGYDAAFNSVGEGVAKYVQHLASK
jgi:ADP-L-glycero-D-manno-heptose 6-epimerase